ncbi:MAG: polyphosphate kinase 1 [Bacteroidales bacterium]
MKIQTINREISWLSFNEKVLQEAADPRVPLIERLRFLGIFSNNLDEFFRVRVATLRRLRDLAAENPEALSYDPDQILQQVGQINHNLQQRFNAIYSELLRLLEKENILLIDESQLTREQGAFVNHYFREQVRPHLFPVMIGSFKRSSFLEDRAIYLAVHMQSNDPQGAGNHALIKVPSATLPRFVILPKTDIHNYIIMLDDVIRYNLHDVFPIGGYNVFRAYSITLTRDSELEIDKDVSRSFMERMSESLSQRKSGRPVRFLYDQQIPPEFLQLLTERLKITERDTMLPEGRYHNFRDYMKFPNVGGTHLEYQPMPPLPHRHLASHRSIFEAIRQKDVLLHFPYQSFHYIIDWLREASIDPGVKSIKMTLYRVAPDSRVINALVNAARNGKAVTVFMELQARFDERANIRWSEVLQREGVRIIHGTAGLKVHCKLILIKRKEGRQQELFANIATGNYNENTSTLYADHSLLTFNPAITREVEKVFGMFEETYYSLVNFNHLIVSPFHTRKVMLRLISREIKNAREGKPAEIFLKLNSLMDHTLVKKLYKASAAGVRCRLIVRGICVLIPGLPGISENIQAISIVDRFLEHSRVFVFHNQGDPQVIISSADLMIRNLDHRIEVGCPILDPELKEQILAMMELQWLDNQKARIIDAQQQNQYREDPSQQPVRSQKAIYDLLKMDYSN